MASTQAAMSSSVGLKSGERFPRSRIAVASHDSSSSTATANVNALRQFAQQNSQPQPHQGQSICGGKVIGASSHVQWLTSSLLAFFRYRCFLAGGILECVLDMPLLLFGGQGDYEFQCASQLAFV